MLGEGGYVVPPASFLHGLRQICDQHGILLIVDEIQSGFGRTGKWFAIEHFGVMPDIMTVAKGLASGLPLSGVFSRMELMQKWTPGSHGGTYGGNAVACAAAVATIQAMQEEGMLENARAARRAADDRAAPPAGGVPGHRRCARPGPDDRRRVPHRRSASPIRPAPKPWRTPAWTAS